MVIINPEPMKSSELKQKISVEKWPTQTDHTKKINDRNNNAKTENQNQDFKVLSSSLFSTEGSFSVRQFYQDKTLLLTGGSGFIGKVLIEKLLRECRPKRIYLLMRTKKSKSPKERLDELIQSRVFAFNRNQLDFTKLVVISSDISEPNLGLSTEDRRLLIENVQVVFHSAATVQFHGELNNFIEQNVFGTQSMMELCTEMSNLKSVIYVSTAYANCQLKDIEEKVYPLWKIDDTDSSTLDNLINNAIRDYGKVSLKKGHPALFGRPNCYTLSKAIAETLVQQKYFDRLPITICRPSIVTHAYREPEVGWCDTIQGLSGALVLGGLGIARTIKLNPDCKADIIPVDVVANSLITIGAHSALFPQQRKQVVHLASGYENPITWQQILDYTRESYNQKPSMKQIRPLAKHPVALRTSLGLLQYHFIRIFSHYLFALLIDGLLFCAGQKRFLMKIIKRMHKGFDAIEHFASHDWLFHNQNYQKIHRLLSSEEQRIFYGNISGIDWIKYCDSIVIGSRRYLLNEDDSTIDHAKRRQFMLNLFFPVIEFLFCILLPICLIVWMFV